MALLMAEMASLAYLRFEDTSEASDGENSELDRLIDQIVAASTSGARRRLFQEALSLSTARYQTATRRQLADLLAVMDFKLVDTYNVQGTQAFLAARTSPPEDGSSGERIAVLSFRGTEPDIRDYAADLKAHKSEREGFIVHTGFWDAFKCVEARIKNDLRELGDDCALYITGHSLGGALALIATREVASDSTGACYTFGSPRVAGYGFAQEIRTPIYRVVNSNDVVPRLPPAYLTHLLMFLVTILPLPGSSWISKFLEKFAGYVHHGDMRYLTRTRGEGSLDYSGVQLLANPGIIHRTWWYVRGMLRDFRSPVTDHTKHTYCRKLEQYARRRSGR